MGFLEAYKMLEKLCCEIYGTNHGVSSYIDDMSQQSSAAYRIPGWSDDLRQLKHYRYVRNQIVHDPASSEDNMCESGDELWGHNFYHRILNCDDPIARYRKRTSNTTLGVRSAKTGYVSSVSKTPNTTVERSETHTVYVQTPNLTPKTTPKTTAPLTKTTRETKYKITSKTTQSANQDFEYGEKREPLGYYGKRKSPPLPFVVRMVLFFGAVSVLVIVLGLILTAVSSI